ncbi:MAG: 3-oxoacyl-[acyl-carrier protein] reductase [Gammaproteobacteria bacterium]|jgi:3-oxoacyl-[acyl-carrier protein] reductase
MRVHTVCPGCVQGDWLREGMGAERYDRVLASLRANNPIAEAGSAPDMAQAPVWFVEGADMITGEFLMVDGGNHLGAAPLKAR